MLKSFDPDNRTNYAEYIRSEGCFTSNENFLAYYSLNMLMKDCKRKKDYTLFKKEFLSELKRVNEYFVKKEKRILSTSESVTIQSGKTPRALISQFVELEEVATTLLKYVALNRTGFYKLLGKKRMDKRITLDLEKQCAKAHFLTSRKLDDLVIDCQKKIAELATKEENVKLEVEPFLSEEETLLTSLDSDENLIPPGKPSSKRESEEKPASTWAFILGTFVQQMADNANKLFVPLILLEMTNPGIMAILSAVLTGLQSFGALLGGSLCSKYNPRSILVNFVYLRTFLALSLALTYTLYASLGLLSKDVTLILVLGIASIDWCFRGIIDTVRNILPMAFSKFQKDALDKINTKFFAVFELGSLGGPALQGIFLAVGLSMDKIGWIPFAGFVVNCIIDLWIPKVSITTTENAKSTSAYDALLDDDTQGPVEEKRSAFAAFWQRRLQFFVQIWHAMRFVWKKNLVLVFLLILLFQLYRIRAILPQIIGKEVFDNESYAAWIFCAYAGGNVIGSLLYAIVRGKIAVSSLILLGALGSGILSVSWLEWELESMWFLIVILASSIIFSVFNMLGRTALQTVLQLDLKGEGEGVHVMAFNRFLTTIFSMVLRLIIGLFFLGSAFKGFVYLSFFAAAFAVGLIIGAVLLRKKDDAYNAGALIVFEGLDGAGKSTQVQRLKHALQRKYFMVTSTAWSRPCIHSDYVRFLKHELPMRNVLLTIVQAMEFKYLVKKYIIHEVNNNKIVICDRYHYTAIARGIARGFRREWLEVLYQVPKDPDLVVYVNISPKLATDRVVNRSSAEPSLSDDNQDHKVVVKGKEGEAKVSVYEAGLDVGDESLSIMENFVRFQTKVSAQYDGFCADLSSLWFRVDATRSREGLANDILARTLHMLKQTPHHVLKFGSTEFDHDPRVDNPKFLALVKGNDGLHWYFRRTMMDMRRRLQQVVNLTRVGRVFLHGNPHLNNYAAINDKGSCMIDFDRACFGPYLWDLLRFLLSVTIKKVDSLVEPELRPGFLRAFKRGYKFGIRNPNKPFKPMKHLEAFDMSNKPEPGKPNTFFKKRVRIMKANPVDPEDPVLVKMVSKYAKALESNTLLEKYKIIRAGAVSNWNGRLRHLVMLRKRGVEIDEEFTKTILVDIKPCFHDHDLKFFKNPFPNSQSLRMQTAAKLYAPNFYVHQTGFVFEGKEYFGRRVPKINLKLLPKFSEECYKDLMYSVGTQLGVAHAKTFDGDLKELERQFKRHFNSYVSVIYRIKDELEGAFYRYLESVREMEKDAPVELED